MNCTVEQDPLWKMARNGLHRPRLTSTNPEHRNGVYTPLQYGSTRKRAIFLQFAAMGLSLHIANVELAPPCEKLLCFSKLNS